MRKSIMGGCRFRNCIKFNKEISLEGIEHDSLMCRIQFEVFGI